MTTGTTIGEAMREATKKFNIEEQLLIASYLLEVKKQLEKE